jgi:hypothetical protein
VTTSENPIYRISPAIIKEFQKDLFALQDKRLLGIDQEEIATLSVKTREQQYTLVKGDADRGEDPGGKWIVKEQPNEALDQETVDLFVSRVTNLPAELRVLKQAGQLAPYGLTSPSAEFIATSRDGKRQGRLVLGNKVNGLIYAMGQALPGIFQVRSDILTQTPAQKDLFAKSTRPKP